MHDGVFIMNHNESQHSNHNHTAYIDTHIHHHNTHLFVHSSSNSVQPSEPSATTVPLGSHPPVLPPFDPCPGATQPPANVPLREACDSGHHSESTPTFPQEPEGTGLPRAVSGMTVPPLVLDAWGPCRLLCPGNERVHGALVGRRVYVVVLRFLSNQSCATRHG